MVGKSGRRKMTVFVRRETVAFTPEPGVSHPCWPGYKTVTGSMSYMPYEDEELLELAKKLAEEYGLELEVVNVNSFKGKLKAKLAGVKGAPAVKVGDKVFNGTVGEEKLRKALDEMKGIRPA